LFKILQDNTICLTRGDIASIEVSARLQDGSEYTFAKGDVVRLLVFGEHKYSDVVIRKEVTVSDETKVVTINLTKDDTKLGNPISHSVDYCYEVELNPDTAPQTIIGHDVSGKKIFRLYPEGGAE